jgi:hypothetical protein
MSRLQGYETVAERLVRFWEEWPSGRILTEVTEHGPGPDRWVVRASVWRDHLEVAPAATGWAEEMVSARGVNATSALENCETSAVGRALANLGMGGAGMPRPSAEEMAKVERMKAEPVPTAEESLARIDAAAASLGMDRAAVTSKWRSRNLVDVDNLPMVDPRDLAILARAVEAAVKR